MGGGALDAAPELREFVKRTGIPVAATLMGLGTFPEGQPLSLGMLGMHGTVYANYAVNEADLLLALGVRFDDRVTGVRQLQLMVRKYAVDLNDVASVGDPITVIGWRSRGYNQDVASVVGMVCAYTNAFV